ncbi:MAG: hypothetical protein K0Q71_787 [Thermomicrobiales bacterium]|nr:hypothetical protein [Thermomicrobiales bacterium]
MPPPVTSAIRQRMPRAWAGDALALVHIISRIFGSYTRGVITESIVVGLLTGFGYFVIGVEVWLPLGVIAVVGEMVPIIGSWIAFFIAMPVVLATQPDKALLALGLFVVVQLLGSWLLAPRIRGGSVNLTPAATILVLALGGAIAGPLGIILALPAAALLRDLASYTSHRAGGLSPLESLEQLPSFSRVAESRRPAVEAQHCQRPT